MPHPLVRDLDHVLAHTSEVWPAMRGQHIFLTGGTGFVGTWLVETFAWANDGFRLNAEVTVLTRNPDAFRVKAPHVANHRGVRLLRGAIQDFVFPEGEYALVIHAATDQVQPSRDEPSGTFDRELAGTRRILEFVCACRAKRLLFTSSGAVYGRQPSDLTHIPEDYRGAPSPVEPESAYGEAKRVSEFLCMAYARQFGFTAVIARLFAFAGPYLPLEANFAIGNFVKDVLAGGPVKIAGDGTPYRSYLYAADMTIWLWNLLVRGESARPYNVGSPEAITILDLAKLVTGTLSPGMNIEIAGKATPGTPPARYVPGVDRAADELGLRARVPLEEQVRRMYEWNRSCRTVSAP